MINLELRSLRVALGLMLLIGIIPECARGSDSRRGDSAAWREMIAFEPIGYSFSLSSLRLNNRLVQGEHPIWSGDLLDSQGNGDITVVLPSVGRVKLSKTTTVMFAIQGSRAGIDVTPVTLVLRLFQGAVSVNLEGGARAYVVTPYAALAFRNGAVFHVLATEREAPFGSSLVPLVIDADSVQRVFLVEPVNLDRRTRVPTGVNRRPFKVPPGRPLPIAFQVRDGATGQPAGRDRLVRIALGKPGVGEIASQVVEKTTNDLGVVEVVFTAGPNEDSTPITVTDLQSNATWTGTITVARIPGIFRTRNILFMVGAAAAVIIIWHGDPGPLRQEGPPRIP